MENHVMKNDSICYKISMILGVLIILHCFCLHNESNSLFPQLVGDILPALRDQAIALPSAAVAISPWIDLTCSGASYRSNAKK